MTLVLSRQTAFQKPSHLHSHLLFCNRTDRPKKSKSECKPTHPDSAIIQCKLGQTQLRTDRRAVDNSRLARLGFRLNRKLDLYLKNLCLTEKSRIFSPQPRQAPERYVTF
jgi:hypothetical protein